MPESVYFSIIIPTYNRAGYIQATLKSVLDQVYTDFEIIVVDDGSTDDTEAKVRAFPDARIRYLKKENGERAAARNFGIQRSEGQYVTFLDSDDLLKTNHLSEAANYISKNPGVTIFHQGYDVIRPDGTIITPWKRLPDPVNRKLVEGNFLSCLGVFVKRPILITTKFNEDRKLSGSEDYELWVRLAARYKIHANAVSTASLVNHDLRSVLNIDPGKLNERIALFKKYVQEDSQVYRIYGGDFPRMFAYKDLYAALHFAISNYKMLAWGDLAKAFRGHPLIITNFRFWVVIKKLIIG